MHKDDQMTPKERAFALFAGKPVDRMPIKLFSPYIGMNFGASYQDAFVEAKSRAHWLIESYKRFGQDGLSVNYRIDGIPVAFGAASTYDAFGIPIIKESVLENIGDVDQLDLEKLRFENDHNAQVAFDAVRYIQDKLNDEIFTGVGLMGPFMEILNGTPESIEQAVIDCFRKCWDNPRGFTIAPGCDIPVTTSLENIDAYMRAARKCAKYPVQPSNWE